MAILKCKMCGGNIEIVNGSTVGVCNCCGTTTTLPKIDDDRLANLFNRANHFRMSGEFDKAATAYEHILEEDDTIAEAHWGAVLSKFGIEYVEDPDSHKRIPTCHRTSWDSILRDVDYLDALKYAEPDAKAVYEEEAKTIDSIQKGILSISKSEDPYDIFICYKETTDGGSRTKDSVLAQDLYDRLVKDGYRVFFSRITLEDKLGTQYEPYIFSALNSAKVMLVIGTSGDNFNAVWVKNEWSRFLQLCKKDSSKRLIPCYRDMDAYDMPEELSMLQSQDMSKIGFEQDLLRGIGKFFGRERDIIKESGSAYGNGPIIAPLLERAFIFLEDGNWAEADHYCERVLDLDPKNGEAYLGKLMADCRVNKRESLRNRSRTFSDNSNFQKALRYGDKNLCDELNSYVSIIDERNEKKRLIRRMKACLVAYRDCLEKYEEAVKVMQSEKYSKAADLFKNILDVKDAANLMDICRESARLANTESLLSKGNDMLQNKKWNVAGNVFDSVLEVNGECSAAYVGKCLASLHYSKKEELLKYSGDLHGNFYWCKAKRYANEIEGQDLEFIEKTWKENKSRKDRERSAAEKANREKEQRQRGEKLFAVEKQREEEQRKIRDAQKQKEEKLRKEKAAEIARSKKRKRLYLFSWIPMLLYSGLFVSKISTIDDVTVYLAPFAMVATFYAVCAALNIWNGFRISEFAHAIIFAGYLILTLVLSNLNAGECIAAFIGSIAVSIVGIIIFIFIDNRELGKMH